MELKKTPKADLETKRNIFLQTGILLTLVVVLVAFEWKTYDKRASSLEQQLETVFEDDMINTAREELPPPPPPPPAETLELEVVDDKTEVEDVFINTEADDKTEIAFVPTAEEEVKEDEIFMIVEENPEFPGGIAAMNAFISKNIQYPQIARDNQITGKVYIKFVVEKDGSVTKASIARGIGGGCDEEALRVVKMMPKWAPGKQRGMPVRASFTIPIVYKLSN
jgi:periplasmic protein TonB